MLAVAIAPFETISWSVNDFEAPGCIVPSGITEPVLRSENWAGGVTVSTEFNAVELLEFTTTAVREKDSGSRSGSPR